MKHTTDTRGIFCTVCTALVMAVALLVSMSGCVGVNIRSGDFGPREVVEGSGEIVTREFDVEDFDKVRIDGDYILVYTEAAECGVSVEMQESLFESIQVDSGDGRLHIHSDALLRNQKAVSDGYSLGSYAPRVYVSAPTLAEMDLDGNIAVEDSSPIKGNTFGLQLSGAGSIELDLAVDEIQADVSGTGVLDLSGTATYAIISLSGAGSLDAFDLATQNAKITISGTGSGSITCSGSLDVDISGAGTVEYKGGAALTQDISGLGIVEKAD